MVSLSNLWKTFSNGTFLTFQSTHFLIKKKLYFFIINMCSNRAPIRDTSCRSPTWNTPSSRHFPNKIAPFRDVFVADCIHAFIHSLKTWLASWHCLSGKFLRVQTIKIIPFHCRICPDKLKSFQTIWKCSGKSGKFWNVWNNLENIEEQKRHVDPFGV